MALISVQQGIADAQRDAAVADTKLTIAVYGHTKFDNNQLPACKMIYTGGTPFDYANQKQDIVMRQVWQIEGRDPDEVSVIMEQLMFLWYKPSVRATLQALGFVGYELTDIVGAGLIDGKTMAGGIGGILEFDVRMTIQDPN